MLNTISIGIERKKRKERIRRKMRRESQESSTVLTPRYMTKACQPMHTEVVCGF